MVRVIDAAAAASGTGSGAQRKKKKKKKKEKKKKEREVDGLVLKEEERMKFFRGETDGA